MRTRASLLDRVKNRQDDESWREFMELYGPLVLRYLGKMGIRGEEARDLSQDIMLILVRELPNFDYEPEKGRFRAWLYTVTANRVRRHFREKERRHEPAGGTDAREMLESLPGDGESMSEIWEKEWRKRCLEVAMEKVRKQVKASTWQSFEQTALEEMDPPEVADRLGLSVGQVYVNKSRVLKRLRKIVEAYNE